MELLTLRPEGAVGAVVSPVAGAVEQALVDIGPVASARLERLPAASKATSPTV